MKKQSRVVCFFDFLLAADESLSFFDLKTGCVILRNIKCFNWNGIAFFIICGTICVAQKNSYPSGKRGHYYGF